MTNDRFGSVAGGVARGGAARGEMKQAPFEVAPDTVDVVVAALVEHLPQSGRLELAGVVT